MDFRPATDADGSPSASASSSADATRSSTSCEREALRVAEEVCREAGVRAVLLEVGHRNPRAPALYERSGFATLERYLNGEEVLAT